MKSEPRSCRFSIAKPVACAAAVGDEAAGRPRAQLAVPRLPRLEDVVEDPGAARLGQELGAEADQPARRHEVLHPRPAGAVVDHLLHPALAQREQLRDDADVLLGDVDRDALDRLVALAVDLLRQHLRLADRQLEALAAHQLDEHRELQLAAALHLPRVRALRSGARAARRCRRAPRRAAPSPGSRSAASPSVPASGHVLMPIVTERLGSSTVVTGSGRGSSGSAIVSPIVTSGRPASATISPGPGLVGGHAVERLGDVELGDARVLDRRRRRGTTRSAAPCAACRGGSRSSASRPTYGRRVEVRDERLQRMLGVVRRAPGSCRAACRRAARGRRELVRREPGLAGARVRVDDRELDLLGASRRGRGRARTPRSRPPRPARRGGRPC